MLHILEAALQQEVLGLHTRHASEASTSVLAVCIVGTRIVKDLRAGMLKQTGMWGPDLMYCWQDWLMSYLEVTMHDPPGMAVIHYLQAQHLAADTEQL